MTTTDLADREHEPFPMDKGETKPWCRTCTSHYQVGIHYPCGYAIAAAAKERKS